MEMAISLKYKIKVFSVKYEIKSNIMTKLKMRQKLKESKKVFKQ